jgi:hypothetical protein
MTNVFRRMGTPCPRARLLEKSARVGNKLPTLRI